MKGNTWSAAATAMTESGSFRPPVVIELAPQVVLIIGVSPRHEVLRALICLRHAQLVGA